MVAESQLAARQLVATWMVLSCFSLPPWYWLNTEKYALLDKLKAIKSIPYTKQEAHSSREGNTNQKMCKSPRGRECGSWGGDVHELGEFPSRHMQLALLW